MTTDNKTKILLIDPANFLGGAELFLIDFLKFLSRKKYLSLVLATTGVPEYLVRIPKTATVKKLFLPRLKKSLRSWLEFRKAVRELRLLIQKEKPDVIYTNSVRAHVLAAKAVKRTKTPLVWMLHDYTFPKFLLRWLGKVPTKIVCVSQGVKEYVGDALPAKYSKKISVIPNGIDLLEISRLVQEPIQLPLKKSEYWIGNVGRIEPWKGQHYFIEAAKKVLKVLPNTRFFVIGSPVSQSQTSLRYLEQLKKLVSAERLASKVYFTGYLKNVYPLLHKLDLLVHTAVEPEPFGRVVLEGMALGKAVIASSVGGPTEVIQDGRDGFLIDPTDTARLAATIIDLCQNQTRRYTVGEAARKTVQEKFTSEQIYGKLLEILKNA